MQGNGQETEKKLAHGVSERIYKGNSQLRIEDFIFPYGKLDPENDWVKLSALVPSETAEERYAAQFVACGADLVTFHLEATEHVQQTIDAIRQAGARVGISIKPDTPAEAVFPWLEQVDMVLVMTVEPGFGGQKYMDSCTEKIRRVRAAVTERKLRVDVEIDGGVTADNIGIPLAAGANVIVAGSAVFQGDIEENVHKLMAQMGNS